MYCTRYTLLTIFTILKCKESALKRPENGTWSLP